MVGWFIVVFGNRFELSKVSLFEVNKIRVICDVVVKRLFANFFQQSSDGVALTNV